MAEKVVRAELVTSTEKCPRCRTVNRLHQTRRRGRYRCGSCGAVLCDSFSSSEQRRLKVSFKSAAWRLLVPATLGLLAVGLAYCAWHFIGKKDRRYDLPSSDVRGMPGRLSDREPAPVLLYRTLPNGSLLSSGAYLQGRGTLRIENGTGYSAVVKIASIVQRNHSIASFYVSARSEYTVHGIPDGVFEVIFALGTDWDSKRSLFTRDKMYWRFERPLEFTTVQTEEGIEYHNYALTLHAVLGGDARTEQISEAAFLSQ